MTNGERFSFVIGCVFFGLAVAVGQEFMQTGLPEWGILMGFYLVMSALFFTGAWMHMRFRSGKDR